MFLKKLVMYPNFEAPSDFVDPYKVTESVFDDLPPVYFSPKAMPPMFENCWCVTRYEDIRSVYQNQKLYSTEGVAAFHRLAGETYPAIPLGIDPPMHGNYRSFLNPHFFTECDRHNRAPDPRHRRRTDRWLRRQGQRGYRL